MSRKEVLLYALKKERSANLLYKVMADNMPQTELADVFKTLAAEELKHIAFFRKEYDAIASTGD
jgi:rubrerythrin